MRGTVIDIFTILMFALVFGLTVITSYFLLSEFKLAVNQTDAPINITYLEKGEAALFVFNQGFVFIIFGWIVVSIILAFLIRSTPAFFLTSLLLFIILVFISPMFSNLFDAYVTQETLITTANEFNFIILVMQNLPIITVVAGMFLIIVIYAKTRGISDDVQ